MERNRQGYLINDTHRECTKCGKIFKRTSKTVTLCNLCNSERVKSIHPIKKMWQRAKSRSKERELDFDIELSDIIIPDTCPILGIKLVSHSGSSGGKPNSPALDRIDNSKGYVKENIAVISHLANQMKASATPAELLKFAEWVVANYSDKA